LIINLLSTFFYGSGRYPPIITLCFREETKFRLTNSLQESQVFVRPGRACTSTNKCYLSHRPPSRGRRFQGIIAISVAAGSLY